MIDYFSINEFVFYVLVIALGIGRYHLLHRNRIQNLGRIDIPFDPHFQFYDEILQVHIPYYNKLSLSSKKLFVYRLKMVRENIEFQSREEFNVTIEVEVLISACITQLTFGFKSPIIPYLKGVIVFPSIFYSRLANAHVKGLAMGNGVVFLSWNDFKEGYYDNVDTYNLGLHEFTHMLHFQSDESNFSDPRLATYFDEWQMNGEEAFQKIKRGNQNFFRKYAGTNRSEFFSVCVENFFEVPEQFKAEMPEVYWHLCYLLKQNPLNSKNDYSFTNQQIKHLNKTENLNLPEYEIFHTRLDYEWWSYLHYFKVIIFIPLIFMLAAINDHHQLPSLARMTLVASGLIIVVRLHYYKNLDAITSKEFITHFFKRVFPLTWILTLIYIIFFVI